jgi:signal transduction histidine kinase
VYTDWTPAIGKRFDVPALALDAINRGQTASDLDVGDEIGHLSLETRYVEVYVPLRLPGQPSMAFEAYYNSERVGERQAALTMELVLLGLLPLVLLQLVQIPIAVSLAGSVARQESERAALLERALSASERERRTIASDLHDGVVQDLAGVSYALGALTPIVPPDRRGIADSCAASVQSAVETLRRLIVDIYPPDLTGSGLAAAIDDLARPLRESGATVTIASEALPEMKPDAAAAIYRVARETLANVAKHSHASSIDIELGPVHDGSAVRLCVADDGVGLAPGALDRRTDGHFGLPMLRDRMADLGGRFTVVAGPRGGTIAEAFIPTHPMP